MKNLHTLVLRLIDDSSVCFDCTVKTLRSLRPLKEVRVEKVKPHSFFYDRKFVISEILGRKLGMTLRRGGSYNTPLEFVYEGRSVQT